MKIRLFVNCEEAGHVCDLAQYEEAAMIEMLLLRIHIAHCPCCRDHARRNKKLTQLLAKAELQLLEDQKKELLRELIVRELAK